MANPDHIYSEAGTYEVTMIASTYYLSVDMLGRKVMDKSVRENDFEIDISRTFSGVFSYRFRDDIHTIQTGKLVVIH